MNLKDMNPAQIEDLIATVAARVAARLAENPLSAPSATTSGQTYCSSASGGVCGECGECVTKNPEAVRTILDAGADRIGAQSAGTVQGNLSPFIDHTLLKPNATDDQVEKLCREAREFGFASVCINSAYVPLAARLLSGSSVKVCTVVGFPLGAMSTDSKAFETRDAVGKGADEIDMVINVGKLKSGDYQYVMDDIRAVVTSAQGRCVKVILETASLTDEEKAAGCILSKAAGAHFVKTSTGFASGGATAEDIALMRRIVGSKMGVKASGGIKTTEDARRMIAAGASRIGASASVAIVKG